VSHRMVIHLQKHFIYLIEDYFLNEQEDLVLGQRKPSGT